MGNNHTNNADAPTVLTISTVLISLVTALFVCFFITFKWKIRKLKALASQMPGPPGWPIIGNALEFWGTPEDILNRVIELTKQYKSPICLWLGHIMAVLVTNPEDIQILLTSPKSLDKSEIYRFFTDYLGKGLLTSPAEKWRRNRRLLGPAFNSSMLEQFVPIFNKHNRILVDKLRRHLDSDQFDVWDYIVLADMDMICGTALGVDEKTPENLKSEFAEAVARGSELVLMRCYKFWLHSDIIFNLMLRLWYGGSSTQEKLVANFRHLPDLMIEKKKEEYKRRKEEGSAKEPKLKVFIEILLELSDAGANFTDTDLRDEVIAIIIAGYDTTAQTNCFCLLMLAIHQDIQEKVYQEVFRIFGDSDRDVTVDDLKEMEYTEMVIKETLRMYPIVPIFLRIVKEDLDLTRHKLPAGCNVAIPPLAIHMDPKVYPNPEKFNPENFTADKIAARHKYSYIPFSAGPRNCIGLRYAMLSMKTTLAYLVRNYRFSTDIKMEDIRLKVDFLLRCSKGYLLKITQRKH